jgi:hypothetical protein
MAGWGVNPEKANRSKSRAVILIIGNKLNGWVLELMIIDLVQELVYFFNDAGDAALLEGGF